jgi:hypothetical protein
MGLIDQAREHIRRITTDLNGFGQQIVLVSPTGVVAAVIGLHRKINMGVDTDGNVVNSRQSYVSISEATLISAGYPYRDSRGEVYLDRHLCYVRDSTGLVKSYKIQSWIPDEATGIMPMLLEIYTPDVTDVVINFNILFPVV